MAITNRITNYVMVSCDSQDTYYLNCMESYLKSRKERGEKVAENVATGNILRGVFPRFPFARADCAGPIWLAYASGWYFRTLTNNLVTPAACLGVPSASGTDLYPGDEVIKKAKIVRSENALGTPQRVDYLEDGIHPLAKKPWPSPLDKGFTNTVFEIVATTNWNGLVIPLLSRMTTWYASYEGETAGALHVNHEYEVLTKRIEFAERRSDYRPMIPGLTSFADTRFSTNSRLRFSYEGTKWLTAEEAKNSPEYKRAAKLRGLAVSHSRNRIVIAIFLCLLLLPLVFVLKRKRRSGNIDRQD
jgi:hypothetical protein